MWRDTPFPRRPRGLTLIEVLIVVVVLGILAAVLLSRLTVSADTTKIHTCRHNVAVINTQVEKWYFDHGTWPKDNLNDIETDPDYFPDGIPLCPVTGQKYKLDPQTHRVTGHDH